MKNNLHVLRKQLVNELRLYGEGESSYVEVRYYKRTLRKLEKRRTQQRKGKHPLSPHGRRNGVGKSRRVRKSKAR